MLFNMNAIGPSELIVISFNVKSDLFFARKTKWKNRKESVKKVITTLNPTIIGTQELKTGVRDDFLEMFPSYEFYGKGRNKKLLGEHSDIIIDSSKATVTQNHSFWLSRRPHRKGSRGTFAIFPRICTTCEVKLKDSGQKIRVFNTHFDHISPLARNIGSRVIADMAFRRNRREAMPTIILGDFNAKPKSKAVRMFSENLHGHGSLNFKSVLQDENSHNTYHGFKGKLTGRQIDYIFVTEEFDVIDSFIETSGNDGVYPSDHYPIVALLRLK